MKVFNKGTKLGKAASLFMLPLLPLLFVAAAASIPFSAMKKKKTARRERAFADSMSVRGRILDWEDFMKALDGENGTMIIERFSFKGPVRMWWASENLYETSPRPLVDWITMAQDPAFDDVRNWFNTNYTGPAGQALLIRGTPEQWRTIRGNQPLTFREGIRYVEVPPLRA